MRFDPIIDYAYAIEDQSQPGHESLRRALVMAILLRDGANNAHDAELYAIAAHPCALTQHVLIDLYLARNAISQLSASELRPPGLTDETLLELKVLGVLDPTAHADHLRALTRAPQITDNMLALALWCVNSREDLWRLRDVLARRISPSEPFRVALWASCAFDHAAPDQVGKQATTVVTRVAAMTGSWRQELAVAKATTLAMWCRVLDIATDAALATKALEYADLWTLRVHCAMQLEIVAPGDAKATLQFLQRARQADLEYGRDPTRRPKGLLAGPFVPWRDHAAIVAERELAASRATLAERAGLLTDPSGLRRLALCAELAHQDRELATRLWQTARRQGLPAAASLIAELRLAYRTGNWAAMHQHYLTLAELSSDATEAHAAWVGAAVSAMRRNDDAAALFCWAAAQDAAPSPIAAFGEKLLRQEPLAAANHYRQLLVAEPEHPRHVRDLARALEDAGKWDELVAMLDEQADRADDHARLALLQQAARVCEERLRDAPAASARYRRILRLAVDGATRAAALEALARLYEGTGAWRALIEITTEQVQYARSPADRALLWFRCGSVSEAIFGDVAGAETYYRKAVAASAACMPAVHSLRELLRARHDWDAVIASLRQEIAQWDEDADRASIHTQIGMVLRDDMGDLAGAAREFEAALALDPDCIAASLAMLDLHLDRADWDGARVVLDRIDHAMVRHATLAEKASFACKCAGLALHDGELDTTVYWAGRAIAADPRCQAALELLIAVAERAPTPWVLPREIVEAIASTSETSTHTTARMARRDLVLAWLALHAGNVPSAAALLTAAQGHGGNDVFVTGALARIWQRVAAT